MLLSEMDRATSGKSAMLRMYDIDASQTETITNKQTFLQTCQCFDT